MVKDKIEHMNKGHINLDKSNYGQEQTQKHPNDRIN